MNVQFSKIPTMADMGFRPTGFKSLGQAGLPTVNGQAQASVSSSAVMAPTVSPVAAAPVAPVQQVSLLTPAPYFAYAVAPPELPPVVVEEPPRPAVESRTLLIAGAVVLGVIAGIVLSR